MTVTQTGSFCLLFVSPFCKIYEYKRVLVFPASGSADQCNAGLEGSSFSSKEFVLAKNLGSFNGPEHIAVIPPNPNATPVRHCSVVHSTGQPWRGDTSHGFAQVPSLPVHEVC